jgi:hypothetical protein
MQHMEASVAGEDRGRYTDLRNNETTRNRFGTSPGEECVCDNECGQAMWGTPTESYRNASFSLPSGVRS